MKEREGAKRGLEDAAAIVAVAKKARINEGMVVAAKQRKAPEVSPPAARRPARRR